MSVPKHLPKKEMVIISPLSVISGTIAVTATLRAAPAIRSAITAARLARVTRGRMMEAWQVGAETTNLAVGTIRTQSLASEALKPAIGYAVAAAASATTAIASAMGNNEESIILDASGRAAMVQSTVKNQTRDEAELARQNLDKMFQTSGSKTIPDASQTVSPTPSL